jgi:hypothetical protein
MRYSDDAYWRSRGEAVVQKFFNDFPQSDIDIVAPDGTVRHRTKAIVHAKSVTVPKPSVVTDPGSIIIPDPSLVIEPRDEIRRRIPSGREETFEVVDPVFHEKSHYIPAHYQAIVRKKGIFPSGQGGNYSVHVSGQNARVNIGSHDHSTNIATQGDVFGDIVAALRGVVKNADELRDLLFAVDEMKRQHGSAGFVAAYRSFVSLAADHLGVLAPFLPALGQLL